MIISFFKNLVRKLSVFRRISELESNHSEIVDELKEELREMQKAYRFSLGVLAGENRLNNSTGDKLPREKVAAILVIEEKMAELERNVKKLKNGRREGSVK